MNLYISAYVSKRKSAPREKSRSSEKNGVLEEEPGSSKPIFIYMGFVRVKHGLGTLEIRVLRG